MDETQDTTLYPALVALWAQFWGLACDPLRRDGLLLALADRARDLDALWEIDVEDHPLPAPEWPDR